MKKAAIGILVSILSLPVIAAEGRWTEGFGQGNLEYFIDMQGFRLYIGCPTQMGSADSQSSVSLSKITNESETEISQFTVTVDGITYDGPFSADSRAGDNNFISFLEGIRKGDAVVKFGTSTVTFPKSNASKVVPIFESKDFSCNMSG